MLWAIAPPSSSNSTSSPVTVLITSGPVMNMCDVFCTMKMKSVIGGRVDGAAGARAHDEADLGDDARAAHVADEDVAVGAERDDALLDARAARVVDADDRAADLGRQVHDLAHLLAHDLAERAAEDREVLAEDADRAAVDLCRSR